MTIFSFSLAFFHSGNSKIRSRKRNSRTMEGQTLKNWVLGKKIGSGACSDVYAGAHATSL